MRVVELRGDAPETLELVDGALNDWPLVAGVPVTAGASRLVRAGRYHGFNLPLSRQLYFATEVNLTST